MSIYSINLILTLSSDIEMAVNILEMEEVAFNLVSNIVYFIDSLFFQSCYHLSSLKTSVNLFWFSSDTQSSYNIL